MSRAFGLPASVWKDKIPMLGTATLKIAEGSGPVRRRTLLFWRWSDQRPDPVMNEWTCFMAAEIDPQSVEIKRLNFNFPQLTEPLWKSLHAGK